MTVKTEQEESKNLRSNRFPENYDNAKNTIKKMIKIFTQF